MKIKPSKLLSFFSVIALATLISTNANAFENTVSLGVETGYSALYLQQPANPILTEGSKSKINVFWGFSDILGVNASASMAWYHDYTPIVSVPVVDEEGIESTTYQSITPVTGVSVQDFAFSLVYAFDIMRITPYASLGVLSVRVAETREMKETVVHELGMRFNIGADYRLVEFFSLGAVIDLDMYLTERSNYKSQTAFLLRGSFIWQL